MYFLTLLSVVLLLSSIEGARILVCVPVPSFSHQVVFYPLVKALLARGHEVVFVTTNPMYKTKEERPVNLTEIDSYDVSYDIWKHTDLSTAIRQGDTEDLIRQMPIMLNVLGESFQRQVELPEFQELIKNKPPIDLVIVEGVAKATQVLSHVFKAPMIVMSSLGAISENHYDIGAPMYLRLLYPNFWHQKLNNLTILDKLNVLWDMYRIDKCYEKFRVIENRRIKQLFGPDTPSLEELGSNVDMLFLNVYSIWESNRPMPPGVVYIGGIHQSPQRELPKDLQSYLDSSERGVVYFSMGINVRPSKLSEQKVLAISRATARLNYDVLVKWDSEHLPEKGNNTKVVTWVPQSDVLRHPNIKAFITQGGLQSFDEALTGGVPLVGIPMHADQWFNVEKFEALHLGVGITQDLTEDALVTAVNKVIEDPSYRQSVIDFRAKFRDQPSSALERAVWWSEYVIRHRGAKHLRAPAANMPWSQFLDLELLAAVSIIVTTGIVLSSLALFLLIRYIKMFFGSSFKLKTE